jgi:hypothetical protein
MSHGAHDHAPRPGVSPAPLVYRAPMRARDRNDPGAPFGLEHDLVGIGDMDERRVERFGAVAAGSFVWTRDPDGAYFLGRVAGALHRVDSDVGIVWARPCDWLDRPFAELEVPAAVAATFARGGRNFQQIHATGIEDQTAALWPTTLSR